MTASRHLLSTPQICLCRPCRQTPAQCRFFRSRPLVICAAKPRYTAAAAGEHRRVLAPRLPTPGASVTSPLHTPREVLFEVCQRRVLLARIKGEVRQVQFCKWTTTIALPPHAGTRGASMRQRQHAKTAPACENCASRREEGFHRGQWKGPDDLPGRQGRERHPC